MGSTFLFYEEFLCDALHHRLPPPSPPLSPSSAFHPNPFWNTGRGSNAPNDSAFIWNDGPTTKGVVLYSIVTTVICTFGIFGNTLSLMILRGKEFVGSVYTYLAVLASTDLALSIIFFIGGLSKGAFYYTAMSTYDALVGLPLSGAINSLSVMATVAVTIDRVLYLWDPMQCSRPKFCNPKVARELMAACFVLAILLNLPYCFIFAWDEFGELITSPFFYSRTYALHNWFMLIVLTLVPAVILILGNGYLIVALEKSKRKSAKCNGKRKIHNNLSMTLVAIIILFLISEIPSSIVSRTRSSSILFFEQQDILNSRVLEIIRQIFTVLGAINVSVTFFLYYFFCPTFCRALAETLKKRKNQKIQGVQVNVFVLSGDEKKVSSIKTKIYDMRRKLEPPVCPRSNIQSAQESSQCSQACLKNYNTSEQLTEESEYIEIMEEYKVPGYESLESAYENESTVTTGSCTKHGNTY
ncbi:hypothetical protein JTB14_023347 [Gonioctena quinquepunctata]|nr:hypothetical protein JTB14_023347 [Gonioctena quinquepunctata]